MGRRRVALCALLVAAGCKTRLYDEPVDLGAATDQAAPRDFARILDESVPIFDQAPPSLPDFSVAVDASQIPDFSSQPPDLASDAFVCPGVDVFPDPIRVVCGGSTTVNVANVCMGNLKIMGFSLGGPDPADYKMTGTPKNFPISLAPNVQIPFGDVVAAAQPAGTAVFEIVTNEGTLDVPILSGPPLSVAPMLLAWGNEMVGAASSPKLMTLKNAGPCPLVIGEADFGGANPGDFAISGQPPIGAIPPGAIFGLALVFNPTAVGARGATLTIVSNDPSSPTVIQLSGTGI